MILVAIFEPFVISIFEQRRFFMRHDFKELSAEEHFCVYTREEIHINSEIYLNEERLNMYNLLPYETPLFFLPSCIITNASVVDVSLSRLWSRG